MKLALVALLALAGCAANKPHALYTPTVSDKPWTVVQEVHPGTDLVCTPEHGPNQTCVLNVDENFGQVICSFKVRKGFAPDTDAICGIISVGVVFDDSPSITWDATPSPSPMPTDWHVENVQGFPSTAKWPYHWCAKPNAPSVRGCLPWYQSKVPPTPPPTPSPVPTPEATK